MLHFTQTHMKLFLTDQKKNFQRHLNNLKSAGVMKYDKAELTEKVTTIPLTLSSDIQNLNLDFFFDYKIFPDNIMTSLTQWQDEGRQMKIADTILQQVFLPPTKLFSQKIIFGVRICKIIDDDDRRGFSYETLNGHVEKGISTFTIEKHAGKFQFVIHTFSEPGSILTKVLGPIFSIPYQAFCTNAALENVKRQLDKKMTT